MLLAVDVSNTMYGFAETVVSRSMFEMLAPTEHAAALGTLIDDTLRANRMLSEFASGYMQACFIANLGGDAYSLDPERRALEGAPLHGDVGIPFFIEIRDGDRRNGT